MLSQSWCGLILLVLVLYTNATILPKVLRKSATNKTLDEPRFPIFEVYRSVKQPDTRFTGVFHKEYSLSTNEDIKTSKEDEENFLSWEIAWPKSGKRIDKFVHIRKPEVLKSTPRAIILPRSEKNDEEVFRPPDLPPLFSPDNIERGIWPFRRRKRMVYGHDSRVRVVGRRFPFASVAKLSTGCTGTLVSPKHVLTAAHCIHNQSDYVAGYKDLKVGILPSSLDSKKFTWIRVNSTFLPNGWLMGNADVASRFDYGLLELEETHKKKYFELGISEGASTARIHFTAYEDDKPSNTLWYRQCRVRETDEHVLYHFCDAKPGSSGAGVYAWRKDHLRGIWQRILIGVFSGNRWRYYKEWYRRPQHFNAAIRLNELKFKQICGWMGKHASKSCEEIKNSSE